MDKLLPCPFCGGEAELHCDLDIYAVICSKCGAWGATVDDWHEGDNAAKDAIAAWNRRAEPKPTNAERIREKSDKELAEISVYSITEPDYDEGLDGEWYECGELEMWRSVFTTDLYYCKEDAIAYTLDWLQQPEKEE